MFSSKHRGGGLFFSRSRVLSGSAGVLARRAGSARVVDRSFVFERFEARTLLAAVFWDGGAGTNSWQDAANWNRGGADMVPQAGDDVTISVAGTPTITYSTGSVTINSLVTDEAMSIIGGTLGLTGAAHVNAALTMNGGTLSGGSWDVTGGSLHGSSNSGTLADVQVTGDLLLDSTSANVRITGTTRFTAARLTANGAGVQFAPGYVLSDLVVAEGAAAGGRVVTGAVGATGALTIAPTGVIRLATGSGGGLSINNSSAMTLVNNGLISAEAAGRTLSFNNTTVNNNATIQATAGTIDLSPTNLTNSGSITGSNAAVGVSPTNWTNPGSVAAINATLTIGGAWSSAGTLSETNSTVNLGGTFATSGFTLTRTGGTINLTGSLNNAGQTITFDSVMGSWNLQGGTITGGALVFPGSDRLVLTSNSGTLADVQVSGDLLLDSTSASVRASGTTRFTAARLTASGAGMQFAPGYVLSDLVVAEGAATGGRLVTGAVGGTGTLTIAPTGVIRLATGSGGGLSINNSNAVTLVNNGLISAEAAGRTLSFNSTMVTNNATMQATAGTIDISPTNWTNPGMITASSAVLTLGGAWSSAGTLSETNSTVNLGGTFSTTGFTLTRTGGIINLTGAATNTGNTLTFTPATGSWNLLGGTITGGTIAFPGADRLVMTSTGGTIASVQVIGELLLDSASAGVLITGSTRFTAVRLSASPVSVQFAPGYNLQDLIVAEGSATGQRTIIGAAGGTGTLTIAPGAVIRLAAGAGGNLGINNSSTMTLVNNGLITAEAAGRSLLFNNTTVTNNGTIQAVTGTVDLSPTNWTNLGAITADSATLSLAGSWSSAGTITVTNSTVNLGGSFATNAFSMNRSGGTVNLTGTATNTGNTLTFDSATGSWNLLGGTVVGGTIAFPGSDRLVMTASGGTITNVQVNGDLLLDTTSASVLITGATRFAAARLSANSATIQFTPGYTLMDLIVSEGSAGGARTVVGAFGAVGTLTVAASGVIRLAPGSGGNLSIVNSSSLTLVNNGLISAEATGRTLAFNNAVVTNNATMQVTAGTLDIGPANWTNPGMITATSGTLTTGGNWSSSGTIDLNGATFNIGGMLTAIGLGTITRVGGTVNVTGTINNAGNTLTFTPASGSWNLANGSISGGTIAFPGPDRLRMTNFGGILLNVQVIGDLLLDTTSASVVISGSTRFTAARLSANSALVQLSTGYILQDLIVAEGSATGQRTINGAFGGPGTLTIAPSGVIRLSAGSGGNLAITNSNVTTLVNNGLISAEAAGHSLLISVTTVSNVSAGVLSGGAWGAVGTSVLTLPAGIVITTNNANVTVGAANSFPAVATLSTNNGSLAARGGGTFTITPAGGTLASAGSLTLGAGNTLSIAGSIVLAPSSQLSVEIAGPNQNQVGRLSATGAVTLAGGLTIVPVNGYVPACINVAFISGSVVGGQFGSQTLLPPPPGLQALVIYLGNETRFEISPIADFNRDGVLNSQDFFDYLNAFFASNPGADFNHDGVLNSQDFFDFVTAFFQGCP